MSQVIVNMNLTLDGVMQAPARPDDSPLNALRLVNTKTTTTGVLIATDRPAEPTEGKVS